MKIKISPPVMVMVMMIKLNLIQKILLNYLKNYIINLLISTNLMKSIINLRIMLQNYKILNLKKREVVFLQTKKNDKM